MNFHRSLLVSFIYRSFRFPSVTRANMKSNETVRCNVDQMRLLLIHSFLQVCICKLYCTKKNYVLILIDTKIRYHSMFALFFCFHFSFFFLYTKHILTIDFFLLHWIHWMLNQIIKLLLWKGKRGKIISFQIIYKV